MKRLVYLAPVALNSPTQRPHHFVQWAHARLGCEVWWVEPYPARLPRLADLRRLGPARRQAQRGLAPPWSGEAWLHVVAGRSLPVEPLPGGARLIGRMQRDLRARLKALLAAGDTWLVVGRPSGLALELARAQDGRRVLFDVMDDMPQFSRGLSRRWMQRVQTALLQQCQAVWGSSSRIVSHLREQTRAPVQLVRNGTALPAEAADGVSEGTRVGDAAHARAPLVLGYVGTLAAWFDWQLLARLAQALPQAQFHIHGPVEGEVPARLPGNVRLLGPVAHARVFGLMRGWHAGLIPFLHNRLTQSVDPVKYYEYRACGLPVLSTLFGEMPSHASQDEGVWSLDAPPAPGLEQRLRDWHARQARRRASGQPLCPAYVQSATWESRFERGASGCGWLGSPE